MKGHLGAQKGHTGWAYGAFGGHPKACRKQLYAVIEYAISAGAAQIYPMTCLQQAGAVRVALGRQ